MFYYQLFKGPCDLTFGNWGVADELVGWTQNLVGGETLRGGTNISYDGEGSPLSTLPPPQQRKP